jgi:hypothetical protein
MLKRKALSVLFLAAGFSVPLTAGGPTYTRFGLGDILLFGGSRISAMGGAGIGLIGDRFINRLNPAGLARISLTRFSGGFEYSKFASEDASETSDFARGDFGGLAIAIPISKDDGVVLSLESAPYSRVNYAIERLDNQLGIQSKQSYVGSGGLSTLSTAVSWSILNQFTLGLKFNYLYGRIRQEARIDFDDPKFTDSQTSRSTYYSGFTFVGGLIYEGLSDALGMPSLKSLTLGAIVTTPTILNADDEDILTTTQSFDTTRTSSSSFDLPAGFGGGFSYTFGTRYVMTGDVYMQQWASSNLPKVGNSDLRNSTRFGLGFEIMPERRVDSYWQQVAYRIGFSYHSTYIKVNGQGIDEYLVTGGLGLPIASDARLNLGFHVGFRGTTSNGLQKDTIYKLSLSLSASEAWFIRIEEE